MATKTTSRVAIRPTGTSAATTAPTAKKPKPKTTDPFEWMNNADGEGTGAYGDNVLRAAQGQKLNGRSRPGGASFGAKDNSIQKGANQITDVLKNAMANLFQQGDSAQMAAREEPPTFESFLAKALEEVRSQQGGGTDYAALRDRLTQNAGESDARLAAMYKQLQGSYANDAPGIQQAYDQAQASSGATADQAAANTNAAYQNARDVQTKQLQELGIQDAAAVIAGQNGNAAQDQAAAVGNIEQNRNAVQQQLGTNRSNAGTFNTQIGQAAGLEGNMQRATVQKALQDKLAELDIQSQQEAAQRSQSTLSQASSLAGAFQDDWYKRQGYNQSLDDADYQKQIEMQKLLQQQATASQFDPQQVIDQVAAMTGGGKDVSLRDQAAMMDALRKLLQRG